MGSALVLFLLSAHTRPIYPAHLAGNPYTAHITTTITRFYVMFNNFVGTSYMIFFPKVLPMYISIWVVSLVLHSYFCLERTYLFS